MRGPHLPRPPDASSGGWRPTPSRRTAATCAATCEFLAEQGIDDLDAVTEATVTGFLVRLREGDAEHPPLSATSAARTVVAVRGFHKFAVADGLADRRPGRGREAAEPAKRLPKALPLADVEAILEAAGAAGTTLALRDRALLEVLYGTGARISEAVGLDVDDLDLRPTATRRAAARQGRQGADGPGRVLRAARRSTPTSSAAARAGRRTGDRAARRCSSTPAAGGCPGSAPGRCW